MKFTIFLPLIIAAEFNLVPTIQAEDETHITTGDSTATRADNAERAAFQRAMETFGPAMDTQDAGRPVDFSVLRETMGRFWAEFPDSHRSMTLLTFYMNMFVRSHPERVQEEWASFINCSSPAAAELARGKVRFAELSRQPFELKFIAFDDRMVDLRKLRGKVILIDFWATWCEPCLKQMPALKRLYSLYHEKGFEIIGVSLNRNEDRRKLTDYISQEGLTWPQHFDGKGWQNKIAMRYAVNAIPTAFLLDAEGKLAGINLEADKLEAEVKRLVGIRSAAPK